LKAQGYALYWLRLRLSLNEFNVEPAVAIFLHPVRILVPNRKEKAEKMVVMTMHNKTTKR
jgi:hypothetical protein